MLKQLKIRNFQVHKNLTLNLDPHITCITGESDVGKSAVLRSLRWLALNRPTGSGFLRSGADCVSVRLQIERYTVVRRRGRSSNAYNLDASEFSCLGRAAVPGEIAKILNVSEVNFHGQHQAPFWFADSPGQVAKQLNTIVNLDVIDQTLANLAAELRKAKMTVEITRERLVEAKKQRDRLSFVQRLDSELRSLEEQANSILEVQKKHARLAEILRGVQECEEAAQVAANAKLAASTLIPLGEQLMEVSAKRRRLSDILYTIEKAEDELCQIRSERDETQAEMDRRTGGRCPLCNKPLKT